MPTLALSLCDASGGTIEALSGSFDDRDLEVLRRFVKHMSRVRTCSLLVRGLPGLSNMSLTAESGFKLTSAPYENSELHELLHVLRPLILHKESSSFDQVMALLRKRFASRRFSDHLKPVRSMFEDAGRAKGS